MHRWQKRIIEATCGKEGEEIEDLKEEEEGKAEDDMVRLHQGR